MIPGKDRTGGCKISSVSQKGTRSKTYELLISGNFHVVLLNHGCLWVTKTAENKTTDQGDYCTSVSGLIVTPCLGFTLCLQEGSPPRLVLQSSGKSWSHSDNGIPFWHPLEA